MQINRIHILNYKCFRNEIIQMHDINRVIGENSSGKTTILESLQMTLGHKKTSILAKDNFNDPEKDIQIIIEFANLNAHENEVFKYFVRDNKLVVVWQWKIGKSLQVSIRALQPKEEMLRPWSITGKKSHAIHRKQVTKKIYGNTLAEFLNLPPNVEWVTQSYWEPAAFKFIEKYQNRIAWTNMDVPASQTLLTNLPNYYELPSVYSFEELLKTNDRHDPISRGVSQALEGAFVEFSKSINSAINEFSKFKFGDEYKEVEDIASLISNFQNVRIQPQVKINEKVTIPPISLSLDIDDGIKTDLQRKGHGLRRLVLYAQLIATINRQQRDREAAGKPPKSCIIGIEEAELYLHPLYQSIFMKQLEELSCQQQYQVIFTSHLSSMIDVFDLETVIRVSKSVGFSSTHQMTYEAIAKKTNELAGENYATAVSVQERIGEVLDVEKSQGLLSKRVVIVEGNTEKYALPLLFSATGVQLDQLGITIVVAGGKGNIDKLVFLFQSFGIPCFIIFDYDKTKNLKDKSSEKQSTSLLKLLNSPPMTDEIFKIGFNYCIFEQDFEATMKQLFNQWQDFDAEARQLIGAKQESGKSLRARYVSKKATELLSKGDATTQKLAQFSTQLGQAIRSYNHKRA